MKKSHLLMVVMVVGVLLCYQVSHVDAWEPKGQCECIAPAGVGGGPDMICRATARVLAKTGLLKPPMYVTNMPGGSAAVAIDHVINKRKGETNLIMSASGSLSLTLAMKRAPYTYDDIIPLAQVGAELGGYFVKSESKYKTLADLVNALKADPNSVCFGGGSSPGGADHIKAALLAKWIGMDPTKLVYVPHRGGGDILAALLGGHVDVGCQALSENTAQLEAGTLRCLAVLSDKRSNQFKDLPTTYEQGVRISAVTWRGLLMPPAVPKEAQKFWSDAIKKMLATSAWEAEANKLKWDLDFKYDDEFYKFLSGEYDNYKVLLKTLGFIK